MSKLTKLQFDTLYNSSGSGTFLDNSSQSIIAASMRQFAKDIEDSCVFNIGGGTNQSKVLISSASILNCYTAPVEIVPAPGVANQVIIPQAILIRFPWNSIAYAGNTTIAIGYDGSVAGTNVVISTVSNVLNRTADYSIMLFPSLSLANLYSYVNKNLCFSVNGGNPTTGNSTIQVSIIYSVLDVT